MSKRLIKLALVGKTNVGKSTFINSLVGEKISIINKKINTTQDFILGIKNIDNTQIIFFDTPGINFIKSNNLSQKKLKTNLWEAINKVDILIYIIDVIKYNFSNIKKDILKISEVNKPIIFIFNKVDVIENIKILPYIDELKEINEIKSFFLISAKFHQGINKFIKYLVSQSYKSEWIYNNNELTDKDDIYITNECTRNAILEFLHQEIPYNINISNILFKFLKNNQLKIKQSVNLDNARHKSIILGKKGVTIKKIREKSQIDIGIVLNCKVHLYLQVNIQNAK